MGEYALFSSTHFGIFLHFSSLLSLPDHSPALLANYFFLLFRTTAALVAMAIFAQPQPAA
jgi:hypothetical protein